MCVITPYSYLLCADSVCSTLKRFVYLVTLLTNVLLPTVLYAGVVIAALKGLDV